MNFRTTFIVLFGPSFLMSERRKAAKNNDNESEDRKCEFCGGTAGTTSCTYSTYEIR